MGEEDQQQSLPRWQINIQQGFQPSAPSHGQDPTAALAELERAVKETGLRGIKMDGTVKGEYLGLQKILAHIQEG
jgi:predicted TIM-barrel fold metal-dependent hydrolase